MVLTKTIAAGAFGSLVMAGSAALIVHVAGAPTSARISHSSVSTARVATAGSSVPLSPSASGAALPSISISPSSSPIGPVSAPLTALASQLASGGGAATLAPIGVDDPRVQVSQAAAIASQSAMKNWVDHAVIGASPMLLTQDGTARAVWLLAYDASTEPPLPLGGPAKSAPPLDDPSAPRIVAPNTGTPRLPVGYYRLAFIDAADGSVLKDSEGYNSSLVG